MTNHKATLWPVWVVLIITVAIYYIAFFKDDSSIVLGQPSPVVEATPLEDAVTTEEAITYIQRGQEILDMGVGAFDLNQTDDMAAVLADIYVEYAEILMSLCSIEGTDEACLSAYNSLKVTYKTLSDYSNQ